MRPAVLRFEVMYVASVDIPHLSRACGGHFLAGVRPGDIDDLTVGATDADVSTRPGVKAY